MTAPGSGTAARETAPPRPLTESELDRLHAAGASARFLALTGAVALALLLILMVDVAVRNPDALLHAANAQTGTTVIAETLFAVASLGAVALLWSYGRSVAAFLRGEAALPLAFRRMRQFVILWTILTALTALLDLSAAWASF
jgi:hypothetical protein